MGDYSTLIQQFIKSSDFDNSQQQILRVLASKLDVSETERYKLSSNLETALKELETLKNANSGKTSTVVTTGTSGTSGTVKSGLVKTQTFNVGRYWQCGNMWITVDGNGFLFCVNGTVAARLEKTGQLYVSNEFNVCNGVVELGRYIGEPNVPLIKMSKNSGGAIEMQCAHSVIRVTRTGMFQFRGLAADEDAEFWMLSPSGETRSVPNGIHLAPNGSGFPNGLCFVYGGSIIAYTHRAEIDGQYVIQFHIAGEVITGMPAGYIDNSIAI